jgi:hypothetical protein
VSLTTALRASVIVAALGTGPFGGADPATPVFGIASANAKGFDTRKRVRGRWITGHFTRRHSAARRNNAEAGAPPIAGRRLQGDPVPTTPAPKPKSAPEQSNKPEPILSARAAQVGERAVVSGAVVPLSTDERLLKLQEALHAHARNLAVSTEPASGVPPAPGGISSPRPASASPEPKAVSFDFQSGVKTTVFTDGSQVEEPFDPASMKGLATVRPVSGQHGRQALTAPTWLE